MSRIKEKKRHVLKNTLSSSLHATWVNKRLMFRQFFCHLQLIYIKYKVEFKVYNKMLIGSCHWTKQTMEIEQCVQLQGKF